MQGSPQALSSLLRPRYRSLLRMRSRRSCILRIGTNFSLIVCFAICLCAAAYMDNIMEDILTTDEYVAEMFKDRASVSILQAILENRGIVFDHLVERHELESAVKATGHLTIEEVRLAERIIAKENENSANVRPDALLYDEVLGKHTVSENHSSKAAMSIVFNSESEFIERVDDNKDSVWLLVVVAEKQWYSNVGISGQVWGSLVQRYSPFGVKMGILDCHRLQSICLDRGLIAVDLVLALPRGGDRIKDSVQFRPFLLQNPDSDPTKSTLQTPEERFHRQSGIMKTVHSWLTSVLAERVRPVRSVEDILPVSSMLPDQKGPDLAYRLRLDWSHWLTRSPQPVHFIWLRRTKSYETTYFNNIPLVISALSVPFTGRIRFWTLDANDAVSRHYSHKMDTDSSRPWPVSVSSVSSPVDLIEVLGCPQNATYLFITPESFCFSFASSSAQGQKEFLNYSLLELYLRFFYPSVDDLLFLLTFLVNVSVLLNSAVTAGRFITAAHFSLQHSVINSILNRQSARQSVGGAAVSESLNTVDLTTSRLRMILSLVNFARRGWTAYTPAGMRQPTSTDEPVLTHGNERHPVQFSRLTALLRIFLKWIGNLFSDLFYANLILLVAILPVINILSFSYFSCVINLFIWLLRVLVTCSPLLKLRSSVSASLVTWKTLAAVTFLLWCLVTVASTYCTLYYARYVTSHAYSHRRRRTTTTSVSLSGSGAISLEAFWADLTRLLVVSDIDNRTERSTSTTSTSSTDLDPQFLSQTDLRVIDQYADTTLSASSFGQPATITAPVFSSPAGFDRLEQTRLLHRLNRLHQLLSLHGDAGTETPAVVSPPPATNSNPNPMGSMTGSADDPAVSSAHIYTWRYLGNAARRDGHGSVVEEEEGERSSSDEQKSPVPESPSSSACPLRSTRANKQFMRLPPTLSRRSSQHNSYTGSGTDYEAGDELDESSDNLSTPLIKVTRTSPPQLPRLRRRRQRRRTRAPSVPLSSDSDSVHQLCTDGADSGTTTGDYSDSEQDSGLPDAVDSAATGSLPNWPSWVIACHSCVVCRRSFRNAVRLGALPCGHAFHEACVRRWLDTGSLHCPLCRWPAYAPHLRQQRQMISQLISTVRSTLNTSASGC